MKVSALEPMQHSVVTEKIKEEKKVVGRYN